MRTWIRKILVVFVSALTLGLVTPAQANVLLSPPSRGEESPSQNRSAAVEQKTLLFEGKGIRDKFLNHAIMEAEQQSFEKFGKRIGPVIEDEFRQAILPNIEAAIAEFSQQYPEEKLESLTISEEPGGGYSEKIFHIKGEEMQDLIRFHVRRENPPKEGFWFNFHYHVHQDNFQEHHNLGSIYWDKNTPPKWRS
ncbi:YpjP family protein [Bacillus massilinigeriensis]|uniref:YpjP family protein n=1 Tax=Bacillus mediterraneensis TaxID=1805474 RepID=UPI0008F80FC0|nr:YpjP family protein [Bacillus mediterraneensis]